MNGDDRRPVRPKQSTMQHKQAAPRRPVAPRKPDPIRGWLSATWHYLRHYPDKSVERIVISIAIFLFTADTATVPTELILTPFGIGLLGDAFLPEELSVGAVLAMIIVIGLWVVRNKIKWCRYHNCN